MYDIERRAMLDGVGDHIDIDVEIAFEQFGKRMYVMLFEVRDQIDVLGRSGNSIDRAGEGAANYVRDAELIQDSDQLGDDKQRL